MHRYFQISLEEYTDCISADYVRVRLQFWPLGEGGETFQCLFPIGPI